MASYCEPVIETGRFSELAFDRRSRSVAIQPVIPPLRFGYDPFREIGIVWLIDIDAGWMANVRTIGMIDAREIVGENRTSYCQFLYLFVRFLSRSPLPPRHIVFAGGHA